MLDEISNEKVPIILDEALSEVGLFEEKEILMRLFDYYKDKTSKYVIDANETCKLRFVITNTGRGDGFGCVVRVNATGNTQGVEIKDLPLPTIVKDTRHVVEIPIVANAYTVTGEIALDIYVDEPHGFGTEHIKRDYGY